MIKEIFDSNPHDISVMWFFEYFDTQKNLRWVSTGNVAVSVFGSRYYHAESVAYIAITRNGEPIVVFDKTDGGIEKSSIYTMLKNEFSSIQIHWYSEAEDEDYFEHEVMRYCDFADVIDQIEFKLKYQA